MRVVEKEYIKKGLGSELKERRNTMKRKRNLPVVEESEEEEVAQNVDEESQSDDDSLQDDGIYSRIYS